ncbi:MAG: chaperone modulator CbpM [Maribacter sp.]|uniref:chaperone modulator CbpM n=1 Tax=Maribacter sp. TaxID=1897614 RepID=UPI003C77ED8E
MAQIKYIAVKDFCFSHGINTRFIIELQEYGLIEVITKEDVEYIQYDELPNVEKIVRLHADLNINLEGIAVIHELLDRIHRMHEENISLKNKLRFYE